VLSFLLPSVAAVLGVVLSFLSWVLIELVNFLGRIDFSYILAGQVPIGVVLLYYSGVAVIAWAWYLRPLARRITVVCTVLLLVGTVGFIKLQRMYPKALRIVCLDVGHGQAIVMQTPAGNLLFDAGSLYNRNVGERVVAPFLRSCGITQIDAVVISHDDIDHINGIVEVVKDSDVGSVYTSAAFVSKSRESGTAKYLADCLSKDGIELKQLGDAIKLSSQMQIKILWPDKAACEDESLSDNDKSVVSLIEFSGRRILLCADIERFAQQQLLERRQELRADVVVVPHHGSIQQHNSEFLKSFGARYLMCSCGTSYFERLQKRNQGTSDQWFYTARDGAVCVCINRWGNVTVRSYLSAEAD
jgi:competence protein ComEC